ncbi:MAG: hypothetical protein HFI63_06180 [Lachnospiraceae bacterium]|nr:hypothetical protein [Lachnospiraceae bacterium]
MKRTCIGIYGKEGEYIRKLAGYIRRRCKDGLEVKAFTKKETLKECLESGGLDGVLAEPDAEILCKNYKVWTVILSDNRGEATEMESPCIDKYQSAEEIWKRMLKLGGDRLTGLGVSSDTNLETVFIGIVSPLHGCGKTSLGLCISRFLAKQGRTLFLTLDEFSCLPELLGEGGTEAELSELYYYYSQGELSPVRLQSALCQWGEAEYLTPAGAAEDLYRDGEPYEAGFFQSLAKAGGYRYMIIDMGNSLFRKEGLLCLCNRLYVPGQESSGSLIRTERFERWLEEKGLLERMVRCPIPREEDCPDPFFLAVFSEIGAAAKALLERDGFLSNETGGTVSL